MRRLTIIESPYAGDTLDLNLGYLRRALRDSWERGELPFASHGFFPFFLHESDPTERKAGIEAGYQFWDFISAGYLNPRPPKVVFYVDLGITPGMQLALERCQELKRSYEFRCLFTKEIPNHARS
jgi:hypothetical protein